ncbi:hypothetical protein LV457_12860 [Mycobacterium sp. MYCO198283]|uniref:DUF7882 family protein n=1 Tax=Mycobacterium sp. MYCO198283 TaxID=2883505 RepID=UPI001E628E3F|nr:hypothetical protein [Mycobacterium sp. MYCO198283]MCG5433167.1 hypothetical protein [Mycobacterium sp. MYCO198283]
MATLRCGGDELPVPFSNAFLAHLQLAVQERFAGNGGGFYLTGTYSSDGAQTTTAHWVAPGVPLAFGYDVQDGDGRAVAPVDIDRAQVDELLSAMDRPTGVRCTESVWLPFVVPD